MTSKFYKWFNNVFILLFVPVVLLRYGGDNIAILQDSTVFRRVIYYANPVLSLILFFFGLYVYVFNRKRVINFGHPILIISLGGCFTLLAYAPPFIALMYSNDKNIIMLTDVELKKIEIDALNLNVNINERVDSAKYYYIETGKLIDYFDLSEKKEQFSPRENDLNERQLQLQRLNLLETLKNEITEVNKYLIWIAIFLSCCFLIILLFSRRLYEGQCNKR